MLLSTHQQGFTLIEMIVSLAVFAMVATTSIGALLVLIATNEQLQVEQSIMTNLSFALDSMTREIRTGTNFYCVDTNSTYSASLPVFGSSYDLDSLGRVQDCANGLSQDLRGLAFTEGGNSISASDDKILYFYDDDDHKIYRRVGTQNRESIISSGIYIKDFDFIVTGTEPLSDAGNEREQPTVTILIKAAESATSLKEYQIQTTVTQRTLDI
jgi:prepilin-type N-terminal cleavage/methylation domain-containing protein